MRWRPTLPGPAHSGQEPPFDIARPIVDNPHCLAPLEAASATEEVCFIGVDVRSLMFLFRKIRQKMAPLTIRQSSSGIKDPIAESARRTVLVSLLLAPIAAGFSYVVYTDDLAVSDWPWRIGLAMMFVSLALTGVLVAVFRKSKLLWVVGLTQSIGLFVVYYFFGIFAYFYLFIFAPVPPQIKWPDLLGGIALTAYWLYVSRRAALHTIAQTTFIQHEFDEQALEFRYRVQAGMAQFECLSRNKSPIPRVRALSVASVAPLCLILQRVLSPGFTVGGVVFLLAVMGMPMSLWFAGVLVRNYIVMVSVPIKLGREHHKPVVVAD